MALDLNPRHVNTEVRGDGAQGDGFHFAAHTAPQEPRREPVRAPSVEAEHAAAEAGQRHRVRQAVPAADQGSTSAAPGTASMPAQVLPQMLWNMNAVNSVFTAGRAQGGLSDAQARLHGQLVDTALGAPAGAGEAPQRQLTLNELATLLQSSGLPLESIDLYQLNAALRFINGPDAVEKRYIGSQADRLRKTLDSFHILHNIGHPQLERQQMLDLLWGVVTVPGHAFRKADDGELAASYQQIAAALNGPPGEHEIALTRHNLEFTTNEAGEVTNTDTDRTHTLGMQILSVVLTVASFIPPLTIPATIANAALQAYQGVKNGDWLQAIGGVAMGVAGAAGAIAGTAISGAAATTARVANGIAKTAYGARAGLQAYQSGDMSALVGAGLQVASGVAGTIGRGAEGVARFADKVQTWSDRVLVGEQVVVDLKNGRYLEAVAGGAALTAEVAGDYRQEDGRLSPGAQRAHDRAQQVARIADYANAGLTISEQIRHGDYAAALADASTLAGALNAEAGGTPDAPGARAAEYLGYAAAAAQVVQHIESGDYEAALAASQVLVGDIGNGIDDQRAPPQWATRTHEYLDYARIGLSVREHIETGDYDAALAVSQVLVDDIGNGIDDQRAPPQWATRTHEYLDYARIGLSVREHIETGDYDAALAVSQVLVGDIGNGIDDQRALPQWATRTHEYLDYARIGLSIREHIETGDYDAALAVSQVLVDDIGNGVDDQRAQPQWAQRMGRWIGDAATVASIVAAIRDHDEVPATTGNGFADPVTSLPEAWRRLRDWDQWSTPPVELAPVSLAVPDIDDWARRDPEGYIEWRRRGWVA